MHRDTQKAANGKKLNVEEDLKDAYFTIQCNIIMRMNLLKYNNRWHRWYCIDVASLTVRLCIHMLKSFDDAFVRALDVPYYSSTASFSYKTVNCVYWFLFIKQLYYMFRMMISKYVTLHVAPVAYRNCNQYNFPTIQLISIVATCNLQILFVDAPYIVTFSKTVYSTDESSGLVQPVLVLSNSPSNATTINVFTISRSATGKRYVHIHTSMYMRIP